MGQYRGKTPPPLSGFFIPFIVRLDQPQVAVILKVISNGFFHQGGIQLLGVAGAQPAQFFNMADEVTGTSRQLVVSIIV
jgi:hypothetical protein